jgi:hypothetical protein
MGEQFSGLAFSAWRIRHLYRVPSSSIVMLSIADASEAASMGDALFLIG